MELLRIVLDAPDIYAPIIGLQARPQLDARQRAFCTMWVNYAGISFEMGVITEDILRDDFFGPAFEGEPMREWWAVARKYWSGSYIQNRRQRKLVRIIDDEYRKAIIAGPPIVLNDDQAAPNAVMATGAKRYSTLIGGTLGVAIGIFLGSRLKHNRR